MVPTESTGAHEIALFSTKHGARGSRSILCARHQDRSRRATTLLRRPRDLSRRPRRPNVGLESTGVGTKSGRWCIKGTENGEENQINPTHKRSAAKKVQQRLRGGRCRRSHPGKPSPPPKGSACASAPSGGVGRRVSREKEACHGGPRTGRAGM